MIRTGWLLEERCCSVNECWEVAYWDAVYLDKNQADKALEDYILAMEREPKNVRLKEIKIQESDNSISDFYNQIEQKDSEYQTTLTKVLTEVINKPSTNIREWLTTLSLCDEG